MQPGDLVKIYHYSTTAREHFRQKSATEYIPDDLEGYLVGLIVGYHRGVYSDYRAVLRSDDGCTEYYKFDRLEVISDGG